MAGTPKPVIEGLPGYAPIHVKIDWPDMCAPAMDTDDWRWLAGKLRALRRPIHVSCMMGHGRTGTALVLLAHFYRAIPKGADPVAWVRESYCVDAVETQEQIRYIETITGRKSTCEPSQAPYTGGTSRVTGKWDDTGYSYDGWSMTDGWKPEPRKTEPLVVTGSVLDDVTNLSEPGRKPIYRVRFCGHSDKGKLCDKPARLDDSGLCDKHFYERS
jgi:hypothetical protein